MNEEIERFKEKLQALQVELAKKIRKSKQQNHSKEILASNELLSQSSEEFQEIEEAIQPKDSEEAQLIELREEIDKFLLDTQKFEERIVASKLAADWLNQNQEALVDQMIRYVASSRSKSTYSKHLLDKDDIQRIYEDLKNYMKWICSSLNFGEPIDSQLQTSLALPNDVYVEAFEFLRKNLISKKMTDDATAELELYLDYLITYFCSFSE